MYAKPMLRARASRASLVVKASQEEIYIGKGRTIKDDPKKYPDRTPLTGGWAGGEAGLWKFRDEVKSNKPVEKKEEKVVAKGDVKVVGSGNDKIYVGQGRYVKDDARKYPGRTTLTGGFAGGERGLKTFVETGEIPLAPEGTRKSPATSPVFVGITVGAAGLLALLLQDASDVAISAAGTSLPANPIASLDENTQTLAVGAIGLGLLGALVGGTWLAVKDLKEKASAGAEYVIKTTLLAGGVFLVAKFILEY